MQEGTAPTPRSEDEAHSSWSLARNTSQAPDDVRSSFYSATSRKASGSFANNLGLLSRREDRTGLGEPPNPNSDNEACMKCLAQAGTPAACTSRPCRGGSYACTIPYCLEGGCEHHS